MNCPQPAMEVYLQSYVVAMRSGPTSRFFRKRDMLMETPYREQVIERWLGELKPDFITESSVHRMVKWYNLRARKP